LISLVAVWLLQDLLQVLAMGIALVPEFFLLTVVYKMVSGPLRYGRTVMWIWLAFAGGILWDLRWASSPGISGLVNALSVLAVYAAWSRTPITGRSVLLFALLAGAMHFVSGIVHYIAWTSPNQSAIRMFLIQQLLGVPVLALLCMILAFRRTDVHV
jgi:hypothetical protein